MAELCDKNGVVVDDTIQYTGWLRPVDFRGFRQVVWRYVLNTDGDFGQIAAEARISDDELRTEGEAGKEARLACARHSVLTFGDGGGVK